MSDAKKAVLIIMCFVGLFITPMKLRHMMVITGRLPGRTLVPAVVTRKWLSTGSHGFTDHDLQYAIDGSDGPELRTDNLQPDAWAAAVEGSHIRVIRADGHYYHPGSVYIEPGSFAFDLFLLCAEIGGVIFVGVWLYRASRPLYPTTRRQLPPTYRRW